MRHNYQRLIKESVAELKALAKQHRHSVMGSRMRFLGLLKSGEAPSVAAATLSHYSRGQCQRGLKSYQEKGMLALLEPPKKPPGPSERMTEAAWGVVSEALAKGEIGSYRQARELLADHGVVYSDDPSILTRCRRQGVTAKTGRPVDEQADVEAQAAFKKTSLSAYRLRCPNSVHTTSA